MFKRKRCSAQNCRICRPANEKQSSISNAGLIFIFLLIVNATVFAQSAAPPKISCSVGRNYNSKYCKAIYLKEGEYSMNIFCGNKLTTLIGGHNELEKQYSYDDSSKIYITSFICSTINYDNIINLGDSISNIRLKDLELTKAILKEQKKSYVTDTLILEGVSIEGLFWKDIRMGSISIGYANVSGSKKGLFDKMLNTFKKVTPVKK